MFARLLPLVLSSVLLGAHFYRAGDSVLAVVVLAAPLLLLTQKSWAVPALQIALFIGAAEWIRTAMRIGAARAANGEPSLRAALTALSAFPLNRRAG